MNEIRTNMMAVSLVAPVAAGFPVYILLSLISRRRNSQVLAVDSFPSVLSTSIGEDFLGLFALDAAVSRPALPNAPLPASSPAVATAAFADEPTGRLGAVNEPVSVSSAPIASSVVSALLSSDASRDLLESPAAVACVCRDVRKV